MLLFLGLLVSVVSDVLQPQDIHPRGRWQFYHYTPACKNSLRLVCRGRRKYAYSFPWFSYFLIYIVTDTGFSCGNRTFKFLWTMALVSKYHFIKSNNEMLLPLNKKTTFSALHMDTCWLLRIAIVISLLFTISSLATWCSSTSSSILTPLLLQAQAIELSAREIFKLSLRGLIFHLLFYYWC